jgi:hypothetical protein
MQSLSIESNESVVTVPLDKYKKIVHLGYSTFALGQIYFLRHTNTKNALGDGVLFIS